MFCPKKGVPIRWCFLCLRRYSISWVQIFLTCKIVDFAITPLQSHKNDFISSINAGCNLENEGMLGV